MLSTDDIKEIAAEDVQNDDQENEHSEDNNDHTQYIVEQFGTILIFLLYV